MSAVVTSWPSASSCGFSLSAAVAREGIEGRVNLDAALRGRDATGIVRAEPIGPEKLKLTIDDDGPGLTPDQREEVVRRGARLDENAPGSGLGLSIVETVIRKHFGKISVISEVGVGTTFTIVLPLQHH